MKLLTISTVALALAVALCMFTLWTAKAIAKQSLLRQEAILETY